jgi:hypothetical protein
MDEVWKRIKDQDQRLRELEGSDVAIKHTMVTKSDFDKTNKAVRMDVEQNLLLLKQHNQLLDSKISAYNQVDVQSILARMASLGEQVAQVGEQLGGDGAPFQEHLEKAEQRWGGVLAEVEKRLAGRIQSVERGIGNVKEEVEFGIQQVKSSVNASIRQMREDFSKAPWERQSEEDSSVHRQELEEALKLRPTHDDLQAFTSLATTRAIVEQLSALQLRTDKQYHGVEAGLSTLERLYLRQLDKDAVLVSLF